jgi:carboxyl-terminal processing protease
MARRALLAWLLVVMICAGARGATTGKGSPESAAKDDYYELYKGLVDTVDQVERNYVKEVDRRELIDAAIRGILSKLDPYSSYIPAEELSRFRSTVESEFGGIGIQVSVQGGQLKVISPLPGTPAYRAGVLAGDRILEINGKSSEGLAIDEAVTQLKGKEGTKVTLTLVHPGRSKKETITVSRQRIHVETVLSDHRKADDSWDFMLDPTQHIGYLRLTAFSRDTAAELRTALEQLKPQGIRALILDLRFNPGGLLNSAIEVSNLFISKGTIVSTKGRNSPERVWKAHKDGAFEGFPMVILVNRYSASASEIVSACLQDHKRAVIMGERTWGKGSVQNVIELEESHAALKLTTASYRRPSGKNIHRFEDAKDTDEWGVMPDKGFQLKLSNEEMLALVADRSARDIVQPKATESAKAAGKPSAAKTSDDAAEHSGPPQSKPPGKTLPKPADLPEEEQDDSATAKPASATDHAKPSARPPFVDRQLEMAVKYLNGELARAK